MTGGPSPLMTLLLYGAVGFPLIVGVVWPVRRLRRGLVAVAPWGAVPALLLVVLHLRGGGGVVEVDWPAFSTGLRLVLEPVGSAFLLLTALLWVAAGAFARRYHADDPGRERFFAFFSLTLTGNLALVLAGDLLTFYLAFALMTFAAYGLVVHRGDEAALRAGRIYIIMALLGEVALLVGVFSLGAAGGGALAFGPELEGTWGALAGGGDGPAGPLPVLAVAGFLAAGFGVKAGLVPLHLWLPLAHPVAPTAASALLSGAMIKAGLLGWLRVLPAEPSLPVLGGAFIVVGVISAFYGVVMGSAQDDPKTVLAYSSVSQMGYMGVGVGILLLSPGMAPAALTAVVFLALHHGVAKGALFLSVGVMGRMEGVGERERGRLRTFVLLGAALPAVAIAGAPLSSGAFAKNALKEALSGAGDPWYSVLDPLLLVAAFGTTLLMGRFLVRLGRSGRGEGKRSEGNPSGPAYGLLLPWGTLVILALGAPLWLSRAYPPSAGAGSLLFQDLLPALLPVIAGGLLCLGVALKPGLLGRLGGLRVPPGDLVILLERGIRSLSLRTPDPDRLERLRARGRRLAGRLQRGADVLARRDLRLMRGLSLGSLVLGLLALLAWVLALQESP